MGVDSTESLTIFVDKRKLSKRSEGSETSTNSSSVTLETLHQLAASYFIDRDSTLRRLHHIQIASTAIKVTETRTGPLGCSNYDNLDSVSSVLVQSPENKIQLQGLQVLLPDYLQERFVQAALSYIACNSEGEFICKDNDCWCHCGPKFPECNCPSMDIQAMEENLLRITDWERTKLDLPLQCYNWTLTLGNKWKTFFETVHIYLRSRIKANGPNSNESIYYEPLEFIDPSRNLGYMKINNIQVFGYSMHFDPEAIRDLILQLDYPYTQGSQDSALLQLLEIRDRVNKLSPPGQRRLDLFSCFLRHRLKLSTSEVVRIQSALQAFNAKLPNTVDYDTTKLCS